MSPHCLERSRSGFSLIENLIAIVLLAIVLSGGVTFYLNGNALIKLGVHKQLVTEMVNNRMEEARAYGYGSLPPSDTPEVLTLALGGLNVIRTVTVTDIDDPVNGITDYKQVEVRAVWTEAGKNSSRDIALTTLLTP